MTRVGHEQQPSTLLLFLQCMLSILTLNLTIAFCTETVVLFVLFGNVFNGTI